jgi:hypothetical protein
MTSRRKVLAAAGVVVGCLLAALLASPVLFKGRIEERVRGEIERATRVQVAWSDVGLTFFRDFPNLTLSLRDLTVVGTGRFEGDTLAAVGTVRLALRSGSIVSALRQSGPIVVRSVRIEEPAVQLRVLEDGEANWDGLRPRRTTEERRESGEGIFRDLAVELRSFELSDGSVVLDNARSGLFASLEGLRHSLSGNFSRESLLASTETHAERTSLRFAGTPWLTGVALDLSADLDIDRAETRVRLLENELRLNELLLRLSGEVAGRGGDVALNLAFDAPSSELGQLLSLVPAIYARDFEALETAGAITAAGRIQGTYGENAFPAFALAVTVEDGSFRYPDLPLPARALSADLSIDNPGGDVDSTVVSLSRFHVEIGEQPLDATLTLRTPVSDPDAEVQVHGTLDLGAVAQTLKLEDVEGLSGALTADVAVRARRSDIDSARYERIAAHGTLSARDVTMRSPELRQPITVEEAAIELSPSRASLHSLRATLGSSDVQATGAIDNLLAFLLNREPLRGAGTFASRRVVLDEWRSEDELAAIPVPMMLDLTLDGTIERLSFEALEMTDARGRLRVQDERLTLEGFSLETLGGRVGLNGHYETTDPAQPTFALDVLLDSLDVAGASAALLTVRTLAPVARYARGTFSANLDLSGALGPDLSPVLQELDGGGSLATSRIAIEGFPLLDRMADLLALSALSHPTVDAVRSSIRIQDGRLHVAPFQVGVGGLAMTVSGSNGIDQSLDYTLGLAVLGSGLGTAATAVVRDLAARAGVDLAGADSVRVGVRVTGTVAEPALSLGLEETATSLGGLASQAAEAAVERQVEEAQRRLEASREEARLRARAQADSLVADAEERAAAIRAEARRLADEVRAEGNRAADEVLSRATNPLARVAAEPVAERLRQEAEARARGLEREADERADALVAEARRRADALVGDN